MGNSATDLIGPYTINTKKFQPDGTIKEVELHLTCMTMIDPATGWFEIVEIPSFIIEDMQNKSFRETIDKHWPGSVDYLIKRGFQDIQDQKR